MVSITKIEKLPEVDWIDDYDYDYDPDEGFYDYDYEADREASRYESYFAHWISEDDY
jgi:hypothetical protein